MRWSRSPAVYPRRPNVASGRCRTFPVIAAKFGGSVISETPFSTSGRSIRLARGAQHVRAAQFPWGHWPSASDERRGAEVGTGVYDQDLPGDEVCAFDEPDGRLGHVFRGAGLAQGRASLLVRLRRLVHLVAHTATKPASLDEARA